jgi:hypothetical protein
MSRDLNEYYDSLTVTYFSETDQFFVYNFEVVFTIEDERGIHLSGEQKEQLSRLLETVGRYEISIFSIKGTSGQAELFPPPPTPPSTPPANPPPPDLTIASNRANACYDYIRSVITLNTGGKHGNLKLGLEKSKIAIPFKPDELTILKLKDGPNGLSTRRVCVTFSKKFNFVFNASSSVDHSTMWSLDIGSEINPGFPLPLPFDTSYSTAVLSMLPDGLFYPDPLDPNAPPPPDPPLSRPYNVVIHSVGVRGIGGDKFLKKFKFTRKILANLKTASRWGEQSFRDGFAAFTDETLKKSFIKRELNTLLRSSANASLANLAGMGFSVDVPDNVENPIFITETPYSFDDLKVFDMLGMDGSFIIPFVGAQATVSVYLVMVSPVVLFVNYGASLSPTLSTDILSLEFKSISLKG